MRKTLLFSCLFVLAASAYAKPPVTFESHGVTHGLAPIPNQYVAGRSQWNQNTSVKPLGASDGVVSIAPLGPRLQIIKTAPGSSTLGTLKASPAYDFVYPVYRSVATGLKVYPQPEVIVKIREGADIFQLASRYNLSVLRPMLFTTDQFVLRHYPNLSPFDVCGVLRDDPDVLWADPNAAVEFKKYFKPNDPLYPRQWHLHNTGDNGDKPGADVHAEPAWDLQKPSQNLVIGVVDDAVDINHPDLNIYSNPIEANGQPGVDDDGNGLIDDVHGWDFAENDNVPLPGNEEDNHGTSVSGVAAAKGDNALGVVGASFGTPILPVRINLSGDDGVLVSYVESAANGLRYAGKYADVINNSWGGSEVIDAISEAESFAAGPEGKRGAKGVAVLFASGNDANDFVNYEFWGLDFNGIPAGSHEITFEYAKNGSGSSGEDRVVIKSIDFVDYDTGEYIDFLDPAEGEFPPTVQGGGTVPFEVVDDSLYGPVFRSASITSNETSDMTWSIEAPSDGGTYIIQVAFRAETEKDGDFFNVYLDGELVTDFFYIGQDEYEIPFSGSLPKNLAPLRGENLNPDIINIGASTDGDVRSSYSQWGPQLDFVAPSNGGIHDIITTDVSGIGNGYDPDSDYTESEYSGFGGTSSASPLAAGVFAMTLAANPDLSVAELLDIFKTTSEKIGPLPYDANGFNEQYGFGRLNMYEAVKMAIDMRGTSVDHWELH
ncbi:MAG: S8 family serine peptidase [bacterium]|nr:S8 family serine peptidase [bacterium]